jgi:hypothetical protein
MRCEAHERGKPHWLEYEDRVWNYTAQERLPLTASAIFSVIPPGPEVPAL